MTSDCVTEKAILITGSTGFVGSHLAGRLAGCGYSLRELVRAGASPVRGQPAEGDITKLDSLVNACAGIDTVVHLVAVIREKGGATFQSVNHLGTVNILRAAAESGVRRFIHMSALGAVNDPAYKYAFSKWQAEEAVKASGVSWTILRPSVIYGRGFGFFSRLVQSMRLSPPFLIPVPGRGNALFQPVAVEDVVSCIVRAVEDDGFAGKVCEIGGPGHVSYSGMVDSLFKVLGTGRVKVPVPMALMKAVVPVMESVFKDPPVTSVELKQLELNNITGVDSVFKNFGFHPRGLDEGLFEIRDYLKSI